MPLEMNAGTRRALAQQALLGMGPLVDQGLTPPDHGVASPGERAARPARRDSSGTSADAGRLVASICHDPDARSRCDVVSPADQRHGPGSDVELPSSLDVYPRHDDGYRSSVDVTSRSQRTRRACRVPATARHARAARASVDSTGAHAAAVADLRDPVAGFALATAGHAAGSRDHASGTRGTRRHVSVPRRLMRGSRRRMKV